MTNETGKEEVIEFTNSSLDEVEKFRQYTKENLHFDPNNYAPPRYRYNGVVYSEQAFWALFMTGNRKIKPSQVEIID